jgi:Macrocin-O-methyltransferase (TylF)
MKKKIFSKVDSLLNIYFAKKKIVTEENLLNLRHELNRIAVRETAQFVNQNLTQAMFFGDRGSVQEFALSNIELDGLNLEFGVYQGKSINFFATQRKDLHFFGFDSFVGLKENWTGTYMKKGHFTVGGSTPRVPKNVTLVPGFFQDTLSVFLEEHAGGVAFAHFDADTYESTYYVLELLRRRFTSGTILIFDEFMGFHGYKQGEYRAWHEFQEKYDVRFEYLAHSFEQVAVKLI